MGVLRSVYSAGSGICRTVGHKSMYVLYGFCCGPPRDVIGNHISYPKGVAV